MARTKSFAKYVREALKSTDKMTIRDLYKGYKAACESDALVHPNKKKARLTRLPARYTSCRIIIHVLRKVGVIKDVKSSKDETTPMFDWTLHNRNYIALVKNMETHPVWDNPWQYLKSERDIKKGITKEGEAILIGESDVVKGDKDDKTEED